MLVSILRAHVHNSSSGCSYERALVFSLPLKICKSHSMKQYVSSMAHCRIFLLCTNVPQLHMIPLVCISPSPTPGLRLEDFILCFFFLVILWVSGAFQLLGEASDNCWSNLFLIEWWSPMWNPPSSRDDCIHRECIPHGGAGMQKLWCEMRTFKWALLSCSFTGPVDGLQAWHI